MRGVLRVLRKLPPLIAIPTTAGTGSEITLAAVITDGETGHKFPINDFALIPWAAVLDVENTRTMPPAMTAATGAVYKRQPEDIANAFVFLASDEASYITGVVLSVDGMART